MKGSILIAAIAAALACDAYASDQKGARKAPPALRARNMTELYMETMPGTLPGGVPVVQQPVNPMGGGTPSPDKPSSAPDSDGPGFSEPTPTPAQPTPAPGPAPAPQPDPTPIGEAPPPPAPPAPPAPPSYGGCPLF